MTIRVLGSFLYGKDELEWIDTLERLKTIPLKETLEMLELSYNCLEEDYKEIFLDVACILKGWKKEKAIRALESCGFHARNGLRVLEQKSLIIVSSSGRLSMHDHIEEMGMNIVRRLHPNEPYRHSRLWIREEIKDILVEEKGTKETRCIQIWMLDPAIVMKGLRNMKELRFLDVTCRWQESFDFEHVYYDPDIDYPSFDDDDSDYDDTGEYSQYLPNSLQYLCWNGYPFTCLPKEFQANNLVGLEMFFSNIDQLWEEGERKVMNKLRFIDFYFCKLRTLDIGLVVNLERLNLVSCEYLVKLHMPIKSFKLKFVNITHSKMRTLDLARAHNLYTLDVFGCERLVELHMPVESCKIKFLNLYLSKLRTLDLTWAQNLVKLNVEKCEDLVELCMPIRLMLKHLKLQCSKLKTLNLTWTPNIETLDLKECEDLVELHMPVESLKLKHLHLQCSKLRTLYLGLSPNLERLDLKDCYNLVTFHIPAGCFKKLVEVNLSGCVRFKPFYINQGFPMVGSLVELCLTARSLDICPLHPENNLPKFQFECIYKEPLPLSTGNLEKLISFGLCACTNLVSLSGSICGLQRLNKLTLEGSIPEVPKEINQLECLEELALLSTKIEHLPDSICMLKHLKLLQLKSCWLLEQLPEDLGSLECLEELHLTECILLRDIPNSICEMKRLKCFHLPYCILVKKLPEEMGSLKCLKELNIEGKSSSAEHFSIERSAYSWV